MTRTAVWERFAALIVDCGQQAALQPAVEEALASGILVVAYDTTVDHPEVPGIEQDDRLIALLLAQKLAGGVPAHRHGGGATISGEARVFARPVSCVGFDDSGAFRIVENP